MYKLKIQSFIASFFSVMFSLSIVMQVTVTEVWVKLILYVFSFCFLLYNEDRKLKELNRLFSGKKYNVFTIVFTVFMSVLLSCIGIYLYINQDITKSTKLHSEQVYNVNRLSEIYQFKIDSINSLPMSQEYTDLKDELAYWKSRRAATIDERNEIRSKIAFSQEKITKVYENTRKEKEAAISRLNELKTANIEAAKAQINVKVDENRFQGWLSAVFIILVLITELVIVNIQKEISLSNPVEVLVVEEMFYRGKDKISINDLVYHPFLAHFSYDGHKRLFNLYKDLGIIENVHRTPKNAVLGDVCKDKEVKLNKLREYYGKYRIDDSGRSQKPNRNFK